MRPNPSKSQSIWPASSSAKKSPSIGRGHRLSSALAYKLSSAVCSTGVKLLTSTPIPSGLPRIPPPTAGTPTIGRRTSTSVVLHRWLRFAFTQRDIGPTGSARSSTRSTLPARLPRCLRQRNRVGPQNNSPTEPGVDLTDRRAVDNAIHQLNAEQPRPPTAINRPRPNALDPQVLTIPRAPIRRLRVRRG